MWIFAPSSRWTKGVLFEFLHIRLKFLLTRFGLTQDSLQINCQLLSNLLLLPREFYRILVGLLSYSRRLLSLFTRVQKSCWPYLVKLLVYVKVKSITVFVVRTTSSPIRNFQGRQGHLYFLDRKTRSQKWEGYTATRNWWSQIRSLVLKAKPWKCPPRPTGLSLV